MKTILLPSTMQNNTINYDTKKVVNNFAGNNDAVSDYWASLKVNKKEEDKKKILHRFLTFVMALLIANLFFIQQGFGQGSITYSTGSGTVSGVPTGVTTVTVQRWSGGGGGGGTSTNNAARAGGGGGGAYSLSNGVSITGTINYTVGAGGSAGGSGAGVSDGGIGGSTIFTGLTALTGGGGGGQSNSTTPGTAGAASTGGTFNGGAGSTGATGNTSGGGGGSSAGTASNGNTATTTSTGASAVTGGGAGGSGTTGAGGTGFAPGGGGAGGSRSAGSTGGGAGAAGKIIVLYYTLTSTANNGPICVGSTVTITLTNTTTTNLPTSTYTVSYNIGGGSTQTASMTVAVAGTGTFTISGLTAGSQVINIVGLSTATPNIATTYVSGAAGYTTTVTVKSQPVVSFTSQPGPDECVGVNLTYSTQASMTNYVWGFPGVLNTDFKIISGGTSSSSSVTLQYLTATSKTITVNYTTSDGCSSASPVSSNATEIHSAPTATVTGQTNVSCNAGSDGTITIAAANGTGPYSYSVDGGTNWVSDPANSYTYPHLVANHAYRVQVKDANGCISK